MLEDAGLETWAVDILGWGFSDLGMLYLVIAFSQFFIFQKDSANKNEDLLMVCIFCFL